MAGHDAVQCLGVRVFGFFFRAKATVARQIVNVVEDFQATLSKEIAHAIRLSNILLVALVVYRVMQMSWKGWVTQAMRLG